MIYSDEMANSTSVSTSYAAMTGSPYAPLKTGRLRKVIILASGDAASSLIEMFVVQLSCALWGVPLTIGNAGAGLRTAPANQIYPYELVCDLPVQTGSNVTLQIKNETGATPVTPRYSIIGIFEG